MRKGFLLPVLLGALAGALILAACGTTPEPTLPPPTQTPWIVVVTATLGPQSAAEVPPTQTPWIVIATATRTKAAETPTRRQPRLLRRARPLPRLPRRPLRRRHRASG